MAEQASKRVEIVNRKGLHARASAKFVGMVADLPDGTIVTVTKDGVEAGGSSILGLMMLGAAKGDEVEIAVTGPNADQVLDQLTALVADRFGEE